MSGHLPNLSIFQETLQSSTNPWGEMWRPHQTDKYLMKVGKYFGEEQRERYYLSRNIYYDLTLIFLSVEGGEMGRKETLFLQLEIS